MKVMLRESSDKTMDTLFKCQDWDFRTLLAYQRQWVISGLSHL